MHFSQDIKIVNCHNQWQVNLALRESGSTCLRLSILWLSLSLFPYCYLLSVSCRLQKGNQRETTTHRGSSAAVKQRWPEPKMPFLQQCHLLWLGLGLASGTSGCQPRNVFWMQKENILAVLPSAQALPLGNLLPCRMYKKRIFGGGQGLCGVCSLVKAQVSVLSTLWENSHGPPWLLWERRNVNQKLNSPNFVGGLPCYAEYLCVHSCLPWLWEKALYLYGNKLVSQSVYVPEHYIIFPDRVNETN